MPQGVVKGHNVGGGTEQFIQAATSQQQVQMNPLAQQPSSRSEELPAHLQLRSIPLDKSGSHLPNYDPSSGGYITSSLPQPDQNGHFNEYGSSGPGVNNVVISTGSVAYGGVYNQQYEGDYYSARRVAPGTHKDPSAPNNSTVPIAQTVDIKVVPTTSDSGEFDYNAVRNQYGDGYSAKRK
jgi:hypothetical protein